MKVVSTALTLVLAATLAFGQNERPLDLPGAELFDEFKDIPCGDLTNRIPHVRDVLERRTGTRALIITHPAADNPFRLIYREKMIIGALTESVSGRTDLEPGRILLVRGKPEPVIRSIVYIVPKGNPIPTVEAFPLDLTKLPSSEPFIFEQSGSLLDENSYCSSAGAEPRFVEVLIANPLAKGRVRIAAKNRTEFQKKQEELIETLSPVSPDRLVFEFVRSEQTGEEFWILPKKAK